MSQDGAEAGLIVAHAAAVGGVVVVWAESARAALSRVEGLGGAGAHGFAASSSVVRSVLERVGAGAEGLSEVEAAVMLPSGGGAALPSATLAHGLGREVWEFGAATGLAEARVPAVACADGSAVRGLEGLLDAAEGWGRGRVACGPSVRYFADLCRFGARLLAQQRFVPMLCQDSGGRVEAAWYPWLSDSATRGAVAMFVERMPVAARAGVDECGHDPWRIVQSVLAGTVDRWCRRVLHAEAMEDVLEGVDASADAQVAWASSLLTDRRELAVSSGPARSEVSRRVRRWIGVLEERGRSSSWRLLIRVNEPLMPAVKGGVEAGVVEPGRDVRWSLSFHVQSLEDESVVVDAADVWALSRDAVTIRGYVMESPQELLLGELGRASRIFKPLEKALDEAEPIEMMVDTQGAYGFLREYRPLLIEQGFAVESPAWWESPAGRLGARLKIESDPLEAMLAAPGAGVGGGDARLGLGALVGYHWEIAIGDTTLTLHEFDRLASSGTPLVRVNGRWVEIRPEDVQAAIRFIGENPGGEMPLAEAMRLAFAADTKQTGVPVLGLEATGWVASVFGLGPESEAGAGIGEGGRQIPVLETPAAFSGTLRPYQLRGLSWLAFLERFGFGACLADDMGLGKTVQLLALLAHERERAGTSGESVKPTLLVAPMSVVGNWLREAGRFTPSLSVLVHHGVERRTGDAFVEDALGRDLVITTYALANRDHEMIARVPWGRVVLDEAQFIKNPSAKQSLAVRTLEAPRRVALTGTPVENRLSELWSIMDFLNPGYLGSPGMFRKKFSVPIERYRDRHRGGQLRGLVRPFVLRRVKTDPTVVADLPEKLETREYTHLTTEQAQLYESCVKRMLGEIERSEGIHRRGVVLAALIRLKQICNHPSQVLKDFNPMSGTAPSPGRSGKCVRLMEMVDEVLAEGERALVFTQFRQMGHLLASMLRHEMGRDVLFLHGGTPQGQREAMVDQFQDPLSKKPILILSLKAGGVGLNLTAATHVFHFDRWWNPAVENQATDRAYRIGQTRTVHVHKFVVRGTLEERIDEMIESKTELAENIIGQGERWLTELDTGQLREILALRADAIGDEE